MLSQSLVLFLSVLGCCTAEKKEWYWINDNDPNGWYDHICERASHPFKDKCMKCSDDLIPFKITDKTLTHGRKKYSIKCERPTLITYPHPNLVF